MKKNNHYDQIIFGTVNHHSRPKKIMYLNNLVILKILFHFSMIFISYKHSFFILSSTVYRYSIDYIDIV